MYTELVLGVRVKKGPHMDILRYLCGNKESTVASELPDHPFFQCQRWRMIGWGCSAYFGGVGSHLSEPEYDGAADLSIRCNLKNYDDEIAKFLDWLHPFIVEHGREFIGYTRYEEDEIPTLLFWTPSGIFSATCDQAKDSTHD